MAQLAGRATGRTRLPWCAAGVLGELLVDALVLVLVITGGLGLAIPGAIARLVGMGLLGVGVLRGRRWAWITFQSLQGLTVASLFVLALLSISALLLGLAVLYGLVMLAVGRGCGGVRE